MKNIIKKLREKRKKIPNVSGENKNFTQYSSDDEIDRFNSDEEINRHNSDDEVKIVKDEEYNPEYRAKFPEGTKMFTLPDIGDNFCKTNNLDEINSNLVNLKSSIILVEEYVNNMIFEVDENKEIEPEIDEIVFLAAQIYKQLDHFSKIYKIGDLTITKQQDFKYLAKEIFFQISRIGNIKSNRTEYHRKQLKKTVMLTNPELTERDVDDKVEDCILAGVSPKNIFQDEILGNKPNAKLALQFALDQRKELEIIEKSISALHQMSIDLASLLQGQGDILDMLESNLYSTSVHSTEGLKMLQIAESSKISSRKKKIMIGITIAVVVGVVVIAIAGIAAGCVMLVS